MEERAEMCK